jgi:hypothetical protein
MTVSLPPSSESRQQADPAPPVAWQPTDAGPSTQARQSFKNQLVRYHMSAEDKSLLEIIANAIFDGNLQGLQRALESLREEPQRLIPLTNILAAELRGPGVEVLPAQAAKWQFGNQGVVFDIVVFSIQLTRAKRVLTVSTDCRFGAHVLAATNEYDLGFNQELSEEPRILLKQIGRMLTFSAGQTPPPFSTR